jgi:uncharacterized membrane protein
MKIIITQKSSIITDVQNASTVVFYVHIGRWKIICANIWNNTKKKSQHIWITSHLWLIQIFVAPRTEHNQNRGLN